MTGRSAAEARPARRRALAPVLVMLVAALSGCESSTVTRVVDGDTIYLGLTKVRLVGIDTPERGRPCYRESANRMRELVAGVRVVASRDPATANSDRYGRRLRFVAGRNGQDVGLRLIREGWAKARYDGLDGFARHARQDLYRAADAASPDKTCGARTPATLVPSPTPTTQPAGGAYPNCTAARAAGAAPVYRGQPGYGPHLDRDGDGIGCE